MTSENHNFKYTKLVINLFYFIIGELVGAFKELILLVLLSTDINIK